MLHDMLRLGVPGVLVTGKLIKGGSVGVLLGAAGRECTVLSGWSGGALWSLCTSLVISAASEL